MRGGVKGDFYDFGTTTLIPGRIFMWIKNKQGDLLNADNARCIAYDREDNMTKAVFDDCWTEVSEGDVTPQIREAIQKNRTFVEVR